LVLETNVIPLYDVPSHEDYIKFSALAQIKKRPKPLFRYPQSGLFTGDPDLLMGRALAAPLTVFLELNLAFYHLLVFAGVIITPCADCTLEADQFFGVFLLRHMRAILLCLGGFVNPSKRPVFYA
jgi:hypothetical protein